MLFLFQMICNRLVRKLNIVAHLTAENLALRQQFIALKRRSVGIEKLSGFIGDVNAEALTEEGQN
jgi:hypothetical protein